jgi:uncharacterized protein YjiS (DUF1127 family)
MVDYLLFWKTALFLDRHRAIDIDGLTVGPLQRFATFLSKRRQRAAEHRSLQKLGDHMLKDIGISRCDVEREIRGRRFG